VSSRLWALFALFIVYGTTIPFNFNHDRDLIRDKVAALSWNPLTRPDGRRVSIPDSVQNVMLFIPFGVLGGLACRRTFASRAAMVAAVTAAGASLSLAVETLQLLTTDRVASLSDVMTNGLGALAGVLVAEEGRRRFVAVLRDHGSSRWLANRWTYTALSALVVLVVAAWQPFDLTLDVSTVGGKVRDLWRDPWQRGPVTDEGNAVVLYALATLAMAKWLQASGIVRAWLAAPAATAALAIGLECSQALVSSRTPAGSDLAVRLLGVALGAALLPAVRTVRRPLPWLGLLFAACLAGAAIATLGPFEIGDERQAFTWFPFLGYYGNNWFPALSHVIEVMLIYFPFGFALGVARLEPRAVRAALALVFVAAAGIEYAQSWAVGRHPDITDVAFSAFGGVLGAWFSGRGAELFERARAAAAG
jgi:glycopeptide antibiotics resistance protein